MLIQVANLSSSCSYTGTHLSSVGTRLRILQVENSHSVCTCALVCALNLLYQQGGMLHHLACMNEAIRWRGHVRVFCMYPSFSSRRFWLVLLCTEDHARRLCCFCLEHTTQTDLLVEEMNLFVLLHEEESHRSSLTFCQKHSHVRLHLSVWQPITAPPEVRCHASSDMWEWHTPSPGVVPGAKVGSQGLQGE